MRKLYTISEVRDLACNGIIPNGYKMINDARKLEIVDMKKGTIKEDVDGRTKTTPVMKVTGIYQVADEKNQNGRIYPMDVMREAVKSLQKPVNERRVLGELDHPCLTLDHGPIRVLTTSGWKDYNDIKEGDYVYSRVNGQMIPSKVHAVIDEDYSGTVYHFKGRHIDSKFTAPHKVLTVTRSDGNHVQEQLETTADNIYKNRKQYNKHRIPRTAEWIGKDEEVYIIPGVDSPNAHESEPLQIPTEVFTAFLGLYLAEGGVHRDSTATDKNLRSYRVEISQIKDDYKDQIRGLLEKVLPGKSWVETDRGFRAFDRRLATYLEKLGDKYSKFIPEDVKQLDGKYLEELVYWFQLGDGRQKHGRSNVFSVSEKLINDLHECWVKAGHCCYRTMIATNEDYEFAGHIIKAENKKPLHQLTLSHTTGIHLDDRFLQIGSSQYDGKIWCLTTEHGNFYMEQNGCSFWTGNCDSKIHLDKICHLITKLWMDGKTVYGESEILNDARAPHGAQLAYMFEKKIPVGISSRGVGDMDLVREGDEECYEVQPGYSIITFDAVAEPSVLTAQLRLMESQDNRRRPRLKSKPKRDLRRLRECALVNEVLKELRINS